MVGIKKVIDSFADLASIKQKSDRLVCRFNFDGTKRWLTRLPIRPWFWKWKGYRLVCRINLDFEIENNIGSFSDKGERLVCRLSLGPKNQKNIDSFADKGERLVCQLNLGFWKWRGDRLVCRINLDFKTPINQTKKDTVPPWKTANLQLKCCLAFQGSFDRCSGDCTKKMNNKKFLSSEQWDFSLDDRWHQRRSAVLDLSGS